jgi:hypothetical protein
MRTLESFLPVSEATAAPGPFADGVREGRRAIAAWLRQPDAAEEVLRFFKVPGLLRGLVRPYVVKALAWAADRIDPAKRDALTPAELAPEGL